MPSRAPFDFVTASMSTAAESTPRRAVPVDIHGLTKRYGDMTVLEDISLSVEPGEVFVIMGPSGAGKSVLLRHLAGLERPDEGEALIGARDAGLAETHERVRTALVFQAGALFNSMSVYDNLAFYPREHRLATKNEIRDKVYRTLSILNLENTANKHPSELSGGMRKRVAIARALIMEPQLLLYDEPTSELDPISAANIAEVIGTLKEEFDVTSIVVSHDRELALSVGDRVALLEAGKLVTVASPEVLKQSTDPRVMEFLAPKIDTAKPRFRQQEGN